MCVRGSAVEILVCMYVEDKWGTADHAIAEHNPRQPCPPFPGCVSVCVRGPGQYKVQYTPTYKPYPEFSRGASLVIAGSSPCLLRMVQASLLLRLSPCPAPVPASRLRVERADPDSNPETKKDAHLAEFQMLRFNVLALLLLYLGTHDRTHIRPPPPKFGQFGARTM